MHLTCVDDFIFSLDSPSYSCVFPFRIFDPIFQDRLHELISYLKRWSAWCAFSNLTSGVAIGFVNCLIRSKFWKLALPLIVRKRYRFNTLHFNSNQCDNYSKDKRRSSGWTWKTGEYLKEGYIVRPQLQGSIGSNPTVWEYVQSETNGSNSHALVTI